MRYIDKFGHHKEALEKNILYLKSIYSRNITSPDPSPADGKRSYKSFKRFKRQWLPLLFEEQSDYGASRCCYCMRKLGNQTSVEHIIPKSLSGVEGQSQYVYYSSFASAIRDHIIMADLFAQKTFTSVDEIDNEYRMPHTTGLSNLVLSCDGKGVFGSDGCCCNNKRKDDKIMPIMIMEQANTDVKYDPNGIMTISCDDGSLKMITDELNSDTLKEIRSVWYHLSKISKDISNALSMPMKERIEWFKAAYNTSNFSTLKEDVRRSSGFGEKANADTYWKLLLAYDWFYYYSEYAKQRKPSLH